MLTKEQEAERQTMIGASEAAGVCGVSKYRSAFQVYQRIANGEVVVVDNEDVDRGTFLEDGCVSWYEKKFQSRVKRPRAHVRHPEHAFIGALPDALIQPTTVISGNVVTTADGFIAGLEIKNPGPWAEGWGADGSDEVPIDADFQARVGMACTGLPLWYVVAPLGGRLFRYPIVRDQKIEDEIIGRMVAFWNEHVIPKAPPPLSFAEVDTRWINARFPRSNDKKQYMRAEELTPAQRSLVDQLCRAYRERETWKNTFDTLSNQLKQVIGEKAGLEISPGNRIDWFTYAQKPAVDWEGLAQYVAGLLQMAQGAEKISFEALTKDFVKPAAEAKRPFILRTR